MAAPVRDNDNRLPNALLLALWMALVSGLLEGGFRLFQRYGLNKLILMSPHVIWMAPVANLFWLAVPALLLLALRKMWPALVTPGVIVGVLAGIAFLPLVLLYTSMHKGVALFLALALGFQASRMIVARAGGFNRMVRVTVIPLMLVATLAGVGLAGLRAFRERQAMSSLPAARAGQPNVLLIIWDTVRGQSLSTYGYERPTTPFLQAFAKEGARFDLALSTAPWTLPSHGSMFTGHRPLALMQSIYQPLVDTFPILSEVLAANGYATAGFVANMAYTTAEHGLGRGFARYEDYKIGAGNIFLSSRLGRVLSDMTTVRRLIGYWQQLGRKNAAEINHRFLDWAADHTDRPFFAFLNYFDAHQPYIPPEPYRSRFMRDSANNYHPHFLHIKAKDLKAEEIEWLRDNYDAAIAYLDDELKALTEELDRRGLLDNTIVIVSSDHGEHLGDHKRVGHMNSLYRTLLQVPLVIRYPAKIRGGTVVEQAVSLRDLPQTVLDLVGIRDSADFPGITLARFWNGSSMDSATTLEPILGELATRRGRGPFSLIRGDYHYIAWQGQDKPAEVYHLRNDPGETTKLTDSPEVAHALSDFKRWGELFIGKEAMAKREAPAEDDTDVLPQ
jgi:arylsulfatase A-like enzyme